MPPLQDEFETYCTQKLNTFIYIFIPKNNYSAKDKTKEKQTAKQF